MPPVGQNKNSISQNAIGFFFFLMLLLPASYQAYRGILLLVIIFFSVFVKGKLYLNKSVAILWIINLSTSLFFIIRGIILKAPGAIPVSTVYLFWPMLYLYFANRCRSLDSICYYTKIIVWGGICTCLLLLLFIVNVFYPTPIISDIAVAQNFQSGFFDGFIKLHSENLTIIPYIFAFTFTLLMLRYIFGKIPFGNKKIVIIGFLLSAILILVSGRRAFWMLALLCPLIIVTLLELTGFHIKARYYIMFATGFVILLIGLLWILPLNVDTIVKEFLSSFEFNQAKSNIIRKEQYIALISDWEKYPLLGHGLGSVSTSCIRSEESPWNYELSYVALLFQVGIIGFLIYFLSVTWIFFQSIKIVKRNHEFATILLPQVVGLICFLIMNASNPYLLKFDLLWILFLPIISINAYLVNKS